MANTIVVADLLQKATIRLLDKELIAVKFANREFEGQLKMQGDTVRVQTFPNIAWATGTAGGGITINDRSVSSQTLTVAQVKQSGSYVADFEKVRSNLDLQTRIAERMSYGLADIYDAHFLATAQAGAVSANQLDDGDLTTATAGGTGNAAVLTKGNIYEAIEKLAVTLDDQNVTSQDRVLFVTPAIASLIRQSGIYDSIETGLVVRQKGYVGMVAGFAVHKTTNSPAGYMIAMQKGSVHFVEQMNRFKVADVETKMGVNILGEALYQGKVFTENDKRIATFNHA